MSGRRGFGTIRRLPSKRWQVAWTDPDGVRRSAPTTFQTKSDADRYLALRQAEIVEGRWRPHESGPREPPDHPRPVVPGDPRERPPGPLRRPGRFGSPYSSRCRAEQVQERHLDAEGEVIAHATRVYLPGDALVEIGDRINPADRDRPPTRRTRLQAAGLARRNGLEVVLA